MQVTGKGHISHFCLLQTPSAYRSALQEKQNSEAVWQGSDFFLLFKSEAALARGPHPKNRGWRSDRMLGFHIKTTRFAAWNIWGLTVQRPTASSMLSHCICSFLCQREHSMCSAVQCIELQLQRSPAGALSPRTRDTGWSFRGKSSKADTSISVL